MAVDDQFWQQLEGLFPGNGASSWYVYAALVFQTNDQMNSIGTLWDYLNGVTSERAERVVKGRKMREALLKASVLVGFPKGINACMALRDAVLAGDPDIERELDKDPSLRLHLSREEKNKRGKDFFSKIYAQHTERVLDKMSLASGGDLSEFAINAVYGDLMAEVSRLDAKETGLLEFLACYASGGSAWSQAKGHMFGSHNLGNGKDEIRGAVAICEAIEQRLDITSRREPAENWEWIAKADKW